MNLSEPARILLDSLDQIKPLMADQPPLDSVLKMDQAIIIQDELVAARVARGEVRCGYKIGFTNRQIWPLYGVHHPIWGPVYEGTVTLLQSNAAQCDASEFCQPRLEPEIVVRLSKTPADATPESVAKALEWVSHGFEVVQSAFTQWQFNGAQAHAAQGLHGGLFVGTRLSPAQIASNAGATVSDIPDILAGLKITINRTVDGSEQAIEQGSGANVLDGPLHAIAHLVSELNKSGRSLQAGDIITTGTMTDAQPLANGQQWQTRLSNAAGLADLSITALAA